jgi:hypothetical protein
MPTEKATPDTCNSSQYGADAGGILRYLAVAGLAFLALVMVLEPDVGFVAPPLARLLFWMMQIGVGLVVLQSVLYLLTRSLGASRVPSWALVMLSGVVGAVLLAPLYWLIGEGLMERWLGFPAISDERSVDPEGFSGAYALLEEYVDIVGPVTTAWLLICLPRLHWLVPPLLHGPGALADKRSPPEIPIDVARASASMAQQQPHWCERLPTEMGDDVIAVVSELQYLRVWTPRGCALILGSLTDVESQGGADGLRVHRSWWVACKHVVAVRRTANGAVCLMSDGRQVPVSRRRRAEVLARFGDTAQYFAPASSETVAKTDLN